MLDNVLCLAVLIKCKHSRGNNDYTVLTEFSSWTNLYNYHFRLFYFLRSFSSLVLMTNKPNKSDMEPEERKKDPAGDENTECIKHAVLVKAIVRSKNSNKE